MKAVNLIPADERRGGAQGKGRTGAGVYVVLGAMAAVVVMVTVAMLAGRQVDAKRGDLAQISAETAVHQREVTRLAGFTEFATLRAQRQQTVTSLAKSRFNWADALREVARTIPRDTQLVSLTGTVAPGVAIEGGSGADPLRASLPVPAFELKGCTGSQADVARVIAAMRRIEGVQRVSLSSSEKTEQGGGGGGGGGGAAGDCRGGSSRVPAFSMTIFFEAPAAGTATPGADTTTPGAPATGATAPAGQSTPASTGATG
jgi:Tfp pilus assembly protein PilN